MCFSPGTGEIFTGKLQSTARPIVRFLILSATWLLLGCNQENQSANNIESSTVEVNRKSKASKLAFRSASDSKVDRITGSISSSTLHQLKFSAISNEKNTDSIPSGSESWQPSLKVIKKAVPHTVALAKFYTALYELESGVRSRPVTILHLGSDRISRDGFSGDLRKMFQERFGNAGRGMMSPGLSYPFYRADGIRVSQTGNWNSLNSVDGDDGYFGLAGVLKQTFDDQATLTMRSNDVSFFWAEVSFIAGPDQGNAEVSIADGDKITKTVSLVSEVAQLKRIRLIGKGRQLRIKSRSSKSLTISSWSVGEERAGIRYINFGLPGATAGQFDLLDVSVVKEELNNLKPDLIILDYGETESQNDELDIQSYGKRFFRFVNVLGDLSTNSSIVIIGVRDINRLPEPKSADSSEVSGWACRNLSFQEQENYLSLVQQSNARLNRWHPPPNLTLVRQVQLHAAYAYGGYFWDWSKLMGGACGTHAWAHATPPLASEDHERLTGLGLRKSARALFSEIISGYSEYRQIAQQ